MCSERARMPSFDAEASFAQKNAKFGSIDNQMVKLSLQLNGRKKTPKMGIFCLILGASQKD